MKHTFDEAKAFVSEKLGRDVADSEIQPGEDGGFEWVCEHQVGHSIPLDPDGLYSHTCCAERCCEQFWVVASGQVTEVLPDYPEFEQGRFVRLKWETTLIREGGQFNGEPYTIPTAMVGTIMRSDQSAHLAEVRFDQWNFAFDFGVLEPVIETGEVKIVTIWLKPQARFVSYMSEQPVLFDKDVNAPGRVLTGIYNGEDSEGELQFVNILFQGITKAGKALKTKYDGLGGVKVYRDCIDEMFIQTVRRPSQTVFLEDVEPREETPSKVSFKVIFVQFKDRSYQPELPANAELPGEGAFEAAEKLAIEGSRRGECVANIEKIVNGKIVETWSFKNGSKVFIADLHGKDGDDDRFEPAY